MADLSVAREKVPGKNHSQAADVIVCFFQPICKTFFFRFELLLLVEKKVGKQALGAKFNTIE